MDINSIEYIFLISIGKIALIVYLVLLLFFFIVIIRQMFEASQMIKTNSRKILVTMSVVHAILIFIVLILAVLVNPAP